MLSNVNNPVRMLVPVAFLQQVIRAADVLSRADAADYLLALIIFWRHLSP